MMIYQHLDYNRDGTHMGPFPFFSIIYILGTHIIPVMIREREYIPIISCVPIIYILGTHIIPVMIRENISPHHTSALIILWEGLTIIRSIKQPCPIVLSVI